MIAKDLDQTFKLCLILFLSNSLPVDHHRPPPPQLELWNRVDGLLGQTAEKKVRPFCLHSMND